MTLHAPGSQQEKTGFALGIIFPAILLTVLVGIIAYLGTTMKRPLEKPTTTQNVKP